MASRKKDVISKPLAPKSKKQGSTKKGEPVAKRTETKSSKISPAKAAMGDTPVFAYIASLPQPQRAIAERVDALAAKTLPALQRSVKWGMAYYGVGDGWCFCCGDFGGVVRLMFIGGAALNPVPPLTPQGMGKATRGLELNSLNAFDEDQISDWMKQVAAVPGVGRSNRSAT